MEIVVDDSSFEKEVLKSDTPVLVDFWAPWCGPCRLVSPIVKEISEEYQGKLRVCTVNVDEAPKTAAQYGIMSIPTLGIFKNGEIADGIVGAVSKEALLQKLRPYIEQKQ